MLYNKNIGVVIQIKPTSFKKGDETKSITVKDEDVTIAYTRILELYKKLENERINRSRKES